MNREDEAKRKNDAALVQEYYQKANRIRTAVNERNYTNLQNWFLKKWSVLWSDCLEKEEKQQGWTR